MLSQSLLYLLMFKQLAADTHKYCLMCTYTTITVTFFGNITLKEGIKNLSIATPIRCFHLPNSILSYKFHFKSCIVYHFVGNYGLTIHGNLYDGTISKVFSNQKEWCNLTKQKNFLEILEAWALINQSLWLPFITASSPKHEWYLRSLEKHSYYYICAIEPHK